MQEDISKQREGTMKKKCELLGKEKKMEELATVACIECEKSFDGKTSKWYLLAIGISLIVLLNMYETSTISFIAGLAFGVMTGLMLNQERRKQ